MKDLISLAKEVFAAIDESDFDRVSDRTAEDCECIVPGGRLQGRDALIAFQKAFRIGFPDMVHEVSTWAQSDNVVLAEGAFLGTHTGPFQTPDGELPPTGQRINVPFVQVVTVVDGRANSIRVYFDRIEFMSQLSS